MEKTALSWPDFHALTQQLGAAVLATGFTPDYLIGVARGGLVPLAILAEELDLKDVATVSARSYDGQTRGALTITSLPALELAGKRVLLVDEICDSGETLKQVSDLLAQRGAEVRTAAVVLNTKHCTHKPDHFVMQTEDWIVFPWDKIAS